MSTTHKFLGIALATSVALTFATSALADNPPVDPAQAPWVKCYGINSCRGQSSCRLTTNQCKTLNTCKGQNSCKGKGFVWKTPENCKSLGGTAPDNPEALK